jgi:hypothetical protein
MAKTQAQTTGTMTVKKMLPSKPITVFRTGFHRSHTRDRKLELEDVKGAANLQWYDHGENYRWVWENAIKDSVIFHAHFDIASLEYRVAVTAQFEPEDLTYYYMRFGV